MSSSAEAIARVMKDFRLNNVSVGPLQWDAGGRVHNAWISGLPVIDITPVHRDWRDSWALYEDSVVRPVFEGAVFAYENSFGNVEVMVVRAVDRSKPTWQEWQPGDQDHVIEWERVRWILGISFYLGGYSTTKGAYLPTTGPLHFVKVAVYEEGVPADLHWNQYNANVPLEAWDQQMVLTLKALTILNCRNVEVLEPSRPKREAKRVARYGGTVSEIHVTPMGRYRRQEGAKRLGEGVPLSTVRGHVARYGEKWGRGRLFGRLEGEFWIPGHLRGRAELGEAQHSYVVGEEGE